MPMILYILCHSIFFYIMFKQSESLNLAVYSILFAYILFYSILFYSVILFLFSSAHFMCVCVRSGARGLKEKAKKYLPIYINTIN